jgi:phosphatidylglycerophosphatase A
MSLMRIAKVVHAPFAETKMTHPAPPTHSHPNTMQRMLLTWFGCGLSPKAPGTIGSLGALPLGIILHLIGGWPLLLIAAAALFVLGWKVADAALPGSDSDPSWIVVDEVVGQWIALAAAPLTLVGILGAFAAFRFFDIIKPWPVSIADRNVGGGLGVMLDDALAGVYAAGVVLLTHLFFTSWF